MLNLLIIITYIIILVSFLHIFFVIRYTYKRRLLEKFIFIIQFFLILLEFGLYTHMMYIKNYLFDIVFEYMYNGASFIHVISSIIFGNTYLILSFFLIISMGIIRIILNGYMGRIEFRKFIWGTSLYVIVLHIIMIFSGIYSNRGITINNGMGGYIYQDEPMIIITYVFIFSSVLMSILLGLLISTTWIKKLDRILRIIRKIINIAIVFLFISFMLRIYIMIVNQSGRTIASFSIIDILIIAGLSVLLYTKDSLRLGYKRVIGSLAFSSTLLLIFFTILNTFLVPPVIIGSYNGVDVNKVAESILFSSIVGFILMGREVYKRPFYPWFSDDEEYYIRLSTSSIYLLIILISLIMTVNLSVHFSYGANPILSEDFTYAIFVMFIISAVLPSLISLVLVKWKNFYIIYGIILFLLLFFIGLKTYNLFEPKPYVPMLLLIPFLSIIYWAFRKKVKQGFLLHSLIMSITLIILFTESYSGSDFYSFYDIAKRRSIHISGHSITYLGHEILNSSNIVLSNDGNASFPLYNGIELHLKIDRLEYSIKRLFQANRDQIFSPGLLLDDGVSLIKISIATFTSDGTSIKIAIAKYMYINNYILLTLTIIGVIGLIILDKYPIK